MDWLNLFKKLCLEEKESFKKEIYYYITDSLWGCPYFFTYAKRPKSIIPVEATVNISDHIYKLFATEMYPVEIVGIVRTGTVYTSPQELKTYLKIKAPDGEVLYLDGCRIKAVLFGSAKHSTIYYLKQQRAFRDNVTLVIKDGEDNQTVVVCPYTTEINEDSIIVEVNAN